MRENELRSVLFAILYGVLQPGWGLLQSPPNLHEESVHYTAQPLQKNPAKTSTAARSLSSCSNCLYQIKQPKGWRPSSLAFVSAVSLAARASAVGCAVRSGEL